ncbi:phosphatase PAP2 family protein [Tardiphaga sp. 215_C5_N2_1]|uniref:phosphatase PAP2 family protein n=1 Tax=Tardiphaga sp. 215_C5_N2_1 TaxID=3240774 RepID=UPI003F8C3875
MIKTLMMMVYGILFLVTVCIYGAMTTYVTQRFSFPLQDAMFVAVDRALGIEWMSLALWVDRHQTINAILNFSYGTISYQLAAPVVVLSFLRRIEDLRIYLLGVSIALLLTIVIATVLPAASHFASIDVTIFQTLQFSGATPVEHLMLLRSDDPAIIPGKLGGLLGFPSFHAVVAVMVPWTLKNVRWVFPLSFAANGIMFASTITEGAHYACDALAGAIVAVSAIAIARRLLNNRALDKESAKLTPTVCSTRKQFRAPPVMPRRLF